MKRQNRPSLSLLNWRSKNFIIIFSITIPHKILHQRQYAEYFSFIEFPTDMGGLFRSANIFSK